MSLTDCFPIAVLPQTGKLGGILRGIVTSRDVDFLERDSLDRPLSDVSSTTHHWPVARVFRKRVTWVSDVYVANPPEPHPPCLRACTISCRHIHVYT